ncbi:MAG: M56 family metallopeptidase, partial [bacterium]
MSAITTLTQIGEYGPILLVVAVSGVIVSVLARLVLTALGWASFSVRAAALQSFALLHMIFTICWITSLSAPIRFTDAAVSAPPSTFQPLMRLASGAHSVASIAGAAASESTAHVPHELLGGLLLVWLAGVVAYAARMIRGFYMLVGIRRRARASETPGVVISDEIDIPYVFGIRKPIIVVPADCDTWSEEQWTAVLAHERAHVARGDVALRWANNVLLSLHWFNPGIRWLVAAAQDASEGACDDAVVLHGTPRASYARALLSFQGGIAPDVLRAAQPFVRHDGLEQRILAIVDAARRRRLPRLSDRVGPG